MDWRERASAAGLLWLRVLMGAGIAYHGWQKVFAKGFGVGVEGLAQGVEKMGLPLPIVAAWVAALSEFAGGILVGLGAATRFAAAAIFGTMTVAAFVAHAADPFGRKELALAYWTMAGTLMLTGAGPFSIDALLCGKKKADEARP